MYLAAPGMVCSVGSNAAAACAAMRAGIAGFDELPFYDNRSEPIVGAAVPGLAPDRKRLERLIDLLVPAISECLRNRPSAGVEEVPLLIGLAEPGRPGGGAEWADRVLDAVPAELGVAFHPTLSHAIPQGHTAAIEALRVARDILKRRNVSACLICGVDSYLNASTLNWLDQHFRLKTEQNSDGVIPGEAAAAIWVLREAPASAVVRVGGLGFAVEDVPVMSDEPFLGLGLAAATRFALGEADREMNQIDFRLSDVTGESYGFKEQSLALSRVLRKGPSELPLWHCADSIGDVGAAAGLCQLVRGLDALAKGYAPGDTAIAFSSGVLGQRAVAVLEKIPVAGSR